MTCPAAPSPLAYDPGSPFSRVGAGLFASWGGHATSKSRVAAIGATRCTGHSGAHVAPRRDSKAK